MTMKILDIIQWTGIVFACTRELSIGYSGPKGLACDDEHQCSQHVHDS